MTAVDSLPPFERTLKKAMLAGVWISAAALTTGLALLLAFDRSGIGDALLRAGLICLMGTPVLRVALSFGEALRLKDYFWFWSTAAVVLVLTGTVLYSFRTAN